MGDLLPSTGESIFMIYITLRYLLLSMAEFWLQCPNPPSHLPIIVPAFPDITGSFHFIPDLNFKGPAVLTTNLPDIGHLGKWSVSSHKFGFGAECLRDDNSETFWQ